MPSPRPVVLVVAYGHLDLLAEALNGVAGLDVVLVDNARTDATRELAGTHGAVYVLPSHNLGFAGGVNLGLQHAPAGRDVLLLNPDAVIDVESVLRLQRTLQAAPRLAAAAPRLRRPDGTFEPTRWPLPAPTLPWRGVVGVGSLRPGGASFLSGAVLLLRREALDDVGPFDERFFLYAEECDWQMRALARGWTCQEDTTVVAEHVGAGTSSDGSLRDRHFHGSAELLIRKWYGPGGWAVFRAGSLVSALRRATTGRTPDQRRLAARAVRLYVRGPARSLTQDASTSE
ncbi:MAG: pimB 2 [Frankiales bacterium]|nr:pimB 2 [Frankiales bacterium]